MHSAHSFVRFLVIIWSWSQYFSQVWSFKIIVDLGIDLSPVFVGFYMGHTVLEQDLLKMLE